jgi:hypothetical protein
MAILGSELRTLTLSSHRRGDSSTSNSEEFCAQTVGIAHPRFLKRIEQARGSLRDGRGIKLEDLSKLQKRRGK